jgi:hypothetical protein
MSGTIPPLPRYAFMAQGQLYLLPLPIAFEKRLGMKTVYVWKKEI